MCMLQKLNTPLVITLSFESTPNVSNLSWGLCETPSSCSCSEHCSQFQARILYVAKNAREIRSGDKVSFATYCAIEFNISGELISLYYQVLRVKYVSPYSPSLNGLNVCVMLEHMA